MGYIAAVAASKRKDLAGITCEVQEVRVRSNG